MTTGRFARLLIIRLYYYFPQRNLEFSFRITDTPLRIPSDVLATPLPIVLPQRDDPEY